MAELDKIERQRKIYDPKYKKPAPRLAPISQAISPERKANHLVASLKKAPRASLGFGSPIIGSRKFVNSPTRSFRKSHQKNFSLAGLNVMLPPTPITESQGTTPKKNVIFSKETNLRQSAGFSPKRYLNVANAGKLDMGKEDSEISQ